MSVRKCEGNNEVSVCVTEALRECEECVSACASARECVSACPGVCE